MCNALAEDQIIRNMTGDDLDGVMEIEGLSFISPWTKRLFEETLLSPISTSFIMKQGTETVGYIILYSVENEAHILNIAVHPAYRRRAYGAALIDYTIRHFRERHVTEFFLEVRESNVAAIRLYHRYGFGKIGKRKKYYSETNEDALVMYLSVR